MIVLGQQHWLIFRQIQGKWFHKNRCVHPTQISPRKIITPLGMWKLVSPYIIMDLCCGWCYNEAVSEFFIISLGIKIGKQIAQTVWHLISLQLQAGVLLILKYGFHNKHREYSIECKNICSKRILIYTRAVEVTKRNELLLIFKKNNLSVQVWVLGMFKLYILGLWF